MSNKKFDREAIRLLLRFGEKQPGPWDEQPGGYPPAEADTDLIDAAPEMLELLEEFYSLQEINLDNYDHNDICNLVRELDDLGRRAGDLIERAAAVPPSASESEVK